MSSSEPSVCVQSIPFPRPGNPVNPTEPKTHAKSTQNSSESQNPARTLKRYVSMKSSLLLPHPKKSHGIHYTSNLIERNNLSREGVVFSCPPSCFLCRWTAQGWPLPSPSGGCLALLMFRIRLSA